MLNKIANLASLLIFNFVKLDILIPPKGTKFSFLDSLKRLNLMIPKNPFFNG